MGLFDDYFFNFFQLILYGRKKLKKYLPNKPNENISNTDTITKHVYYKK